MVPKTRMCLQRVARCKVCLQKSEAALSQDFFFDLKQQSFVSRSPRPKLSLHPSVFVASIGGRGVGRPGGGTTVNKSKICEYISM